MCQKGDAERLFGIGHSASDIDCSSPDETHHHLLRSYISLRASFSI